MVSQEFLNFFVDGEDESAASAAEHVRKRSLEHGVDSLVPDDLLGAVEGVLVEDVLPASSCGDAPYPTGS